jgi:hypothetical protein
MQRAVAFVVLCFTVLLYGCSGNGSGITNPFGASPSTVVKTFYMSCNAGEYSKAEDTLATDTKKLIHGDLGGLIGAMKGFCDKESRQGTITNIDIKSENIRGEGATVISDIHFKDKGTKSDDKSELIKENGAWKITPGTL